MDDWQCLPDNRRDFGLNLVQFVRVLSRRELATEKTLITKRFVLENLHPLSAASFELALLIKAPILPDFVFVHRKWHGNPKFDRSHFFAMFTPHTSFTRDRIYSNQFYPSWIHVLSKRPILLSRFLFVWCGNKNKVHTLFWWLNRNRTPWYAFERACDQRESNIRKVPNILNF